MVNLEVGKLFKSDVTKYQEGIKFDINDDGCDLYIFFNNPTQDEIDHIKKGNFKAGYYAQYNVIFMLFKFGNLSWMDAPYSVHLSKNLTEFQLLDGGQGLALHIYFIDAGTGILKVMRLLSFKTRFSIQLIEEVQKQKELPFENYDKNLMYIMNKYTTRDLIKYGTMML